MVTPSQTLRHWITLCEATGAGWFGDSKVVDSAGKPLVVYHGTDKQFDVFDLNKSREGFFFTNNRERAMVYGRNLITAHLSIQRPAPFKAYMAWAGKGWVRAREEMMKLGFDGLITRDLDTMYLAFSADQIRIIDRETLSEAKNAAMPTRHFSKLYHVGTMNAADKRRGSYEGAGLSVSLHPEEWMEIARIGGPIWQCKRTGNRFLDFYRLRKPHKKLIADWAIEQGLAQRAALWRVKWYDEEIDDDRYMDFPDQQEAEQEAEEWENATITQVKGGGLIGTPALANRMMQDRSTAGVDELVTIVYAEDALKIDGVWFDETLDPANLSAPRGVIVPSMIGRWTFTELETNR